MTLMRSSWRTSAALAAAAAVIAAATAVIWRIHRSSAPVNTAIVYGSDLGAVAVAVTLLLSLGAWWQKGRAGAGTQTVTTAQATAAAGRLAEVTAARWRHEAVRRRIVTPVPVTVRWRWAAEQVAAPRWEVTMPPVPGTGPPPLSGAEDLGKLLDSGVVTRLHDEAYARLPHGRLVIIGEPGAGKTGAMILLLLAALDKRDTLRGEQQARMPVPVWLTLGGWGPSAESLHEWAAATLNRDHPFLRAADYGADAAGELLRTGRVALFLDGLDELPDGLRAAALRRVDEARGLRIVVSSRAGEYEQAVRDARPGNTAVIELRPVRPAAAAAYLLRDQAGPFRSQWEQVATYLRDHPDSVAAQALDNPLTLSLARDVYASRDPAVLTEPGRFPTVAAVREHLVDQLLVAAYSDERQRARVIRRLAWTARKMGTSRDLRWWDIPAWISSWPLHLARAAGFALAGAVGFGLALGLARGQIGFTAAALAGALWGGVTVGLCFGLAFGLIGRLTGEPHALALRWPQPKELSQLLGFALAGMLGFGLVGWLAAWSGPEDLTPGSGTLPRELALGLTGGLVFGTAVALLSLWSKRIASSPSVSPAATYRSDRRTGVILALVIGLAIGLGLGLTVGPAFGLGFGLAGLLIAGLAFGQVPLVKLTELVLACRGHGRWQFLRLLEDACERQVLRQAGTVYQFRHATIQDRLATMHVSPSVGTTRPDRPPGTSSPIGEADR